MNTVWRSARTAIRNLARLEARHLNIKGTEPLLNLLYRPGRARDLVDIVGEYGESLIQLDTRSYLEWKVFFFGAYERESIALLQRLAHPGSVALDIGANVGMVTLPLARRVGSDGVVHAFEPNPPVYDRLLVNIALNNLPNVVTNNIALGSFTGHAELYGSRGANQGMSSLAHHPGLNRTATCRIETMDDYAARISLGRVDLIKIDTEGADVAVLLGGQHVISTFRPALYFEVDRRLLAKYDASPEQAMQFLGDLGYSVWRAHFSRRGALQLTAVEPGNVATTRRAEQWLAVHPTGQTRASRQWRGKP